MMSKQKLEDQNDLAGKPKRKLEDQDDSARKSKRKLEAQDDPARKSKRKLDEQDDPAKKSKRKLEKQATLRNIQTPRGEKPPVIRTNSILVEPKTPQTPKKTAPTAPTAPKKIKKIKKTKKAKAPETPIPITTTPITFWDRPTVDGSPIGFKPMDAFKVAAYSQEARPQHYKKYQKKFQGRGDGDLTLYDGPGEVVGEVAPGMDVLAEKRKKQGIIKQPEEVLPKVFQDKECPHVIAVIEGPEKGLEKTVTLKEISGTSYDYTLIKSIQGTMTDGSDDDRQSMHFYRRSDMAGAAKIEEVTITTTPLFKAGEILFETEKGKKYSILTVHIPNELADDPEAAHKALEEYAEKAKAEGRIVIGYVGDTNYFNPQQPYSSPSVGGVIKDGWYLSQNSSGDNNFHTHFMQATYLNYDKNSCALLQPNVLNHVNVQLPGVRTDHPSIQTSIILDEVILGRDNSLDLEEAAETISSPPAKSFPSSISSSKSEPAIGFAAQAKLNEMQALIKTAKANYEVALSWLKRQGKEAGENFLETVKLADEVRKEVTQLRKEYEVMRTLPPKETALIEEMEELRKENKKDWEAWKNKYKSHQMKEQLQMQKGDTIIPQEGEQQTPSKLRR